MRMKSFVFGLPFLVCGLLCWADSRIPDTKQFSSSPTYGSGQGGSGTNITEAGSSGVIYITKYLTNSAPSLDLNPADLVDLLPAKYEKFATVVIGLLLMAGRIWATRQAGGSISNGLANLVLGHSQAAKNEIAQLKVATGLSQAPAPPVGGVLVVPVPPVPGTAVPVVPTAAVKPTP